MAVAGFVMAGVSPAGRTQEVFQRERDLNQPIVVAVSEVFFPYSYRDTDGHLKGFAHDLLDAAARAVNLKLQRVPIDNREMVEVFRRGDIDLSQFWSETAERRAWADFSVPILRFETVIVVRKDDERIRQLSDLKGKRIAVGQRGNVGWRYVVTEQPEAIPVFTDTSEQFLRQISAGQLDAAAMSRLTAISMIDRFGLKNLTVLDDRIPGDAYDVRYCFAVRKGDALLLSRLNEALAVLHRTGEFDAIYARWFGRYELRTFKPVEVVSYVAAALALASLAATWGFMRQRTLSRRVAKQAAELAEQRSLLAALHEKHPVATVVLEVAAEGVPMLVSVNSEAARLFSLDAATMLPRPLDQVALGQPWSLYLEEVVQQWRKTGEGRQWEARIAATQQLLESALISLGHAESGAHRLCVLSNDVTKRRMMDREIAQSRRLRALGELVGGIAHEFNNLLTPIMLTTSHARLHSGLDAELKTHFTVIDDAARRAAELTRRLLTFGRKSDERVKPVRVGGVVENCFALLRPTVDRRIVWSCDIPNRLGPVHFNPTDLNQIVFNLVINARDALLEKLDGAHDLSWTPQLRVSAIEATGEAEPPRRAAPGAEPVEWLRLTVEDNGVGIAPEIIDRIFEPFFTTKEVGQGTGLGLATVWHLVTEAGGDITVESKLGEGTKLHVFLPCAAQAPTAVTVSPFEPAASGNPRKCRVLLVEDEPLVARTTIAVLERAGHIVSHQPDGAEAWGHFMSRPHSFDLVLADVNMPRLNGVDLVRRLREARFGGRIVMMGGRVTEEERRALLALNVDRIVAKPFAAPDLLAAVNEVLKLRTAVARPALSGTV
jgi:signal transduction histidine kinase/ActR/RegA family two-component response regulator